jgi:hypothetical protein
MQNVEDALRMYPTITPYFLTWRKENSLKTPCGEKFVASLTSFHKGSAPHVHVGMYRMGLLIFF